MQERGKRKNSGLRKHKQLFEEFEVCRIGYFYSLLNFPESFSQLVIHWCFQTRTFQIWPFNTFGYTMLRCVVFHCQIQRVARESTGTTLSAALSEKWILVFKESNLKSVRSFLSILKGMCMSLCTYEGIMVKDFVWRQYLREINWVFLGI